ncbi:hypothetical protein CEUSTIGMA_g5176.t1 [Chlamydomonas eustigma]|uniref:Autophagy-related protein 3 n=1 Tax=Chlamydomonas eustigma TaxID=1157962 RepID=A0A250X3S7_9CHLO|nr:hypothetical protein CEUSTIGMA_g5176.t1 [Chlamydomonas eustigma]|eukprot:GAX77733.1 hypothetical protein CEUSTIGMA_g5176.t1 [Chlamydomonas eustigma]
MRHAIHSVFKAAAEAVLPPLSTSQFGEKGVLTPSEFIQAGDFLVRTCPTWSWEGGDPKKKRNFLPVDKQYLVTRGVPCTRRASELETYDPNSEFSISGYGDEWVATHSDPHASHDRTEHIPSIDDTGPSQGGKGDDAIPDLSELEIQEEDDEAALPMSELMKTRQDGRNIQAVAYKTAVEPEDTILRTRTYDLYITYDQYYQVPRFWLVGFDESRHPLIPEQVMEDVSEEHARKTITVEPHPNLLLSAASIHPCRHAETMKRLVDNMLENGGSFSVDHYLLLFLKFIASVVPTIQYDYTMSVGH